MSNILKTSLNTIFSHSSLYLLFLFLFTFFFTLYKCIDYQVLNIFDYKSPVVYKLSNSKIFIVSWTEIYLYDKDFTNEILLKNTSDIKYEYLYNLKYITIYQFNNEDNG